MKKPDRGVLLEKFGDGRRRPPLRRCRRGEYRIPADVALPDLPALLEIDPAAERHAPEPATVYRDSLLSRLLVVQHGGQLWLVPPRPGGWSARMPLTLTAEARAERLRPAKEVTAAWLGVPVDGRATTR